MRQGASQENSNVPSTPLIARRRQLKHVRRSNTTAPDLAQRVRMRLKFVFISTGQPDGRRIFQEKYAISGRSAAVVCVSRSVSAGFLRRLTCRGEIDRTQGRRAEGPQCYSLG